MVCSCEIYEKDLETGEVTKYYNSSDGQRIAMNKGGTLYFFVNDHLGGTSLVMNVSGNVVSRTRYYPYGQGWTQDAGTTPPTDRLYTGQRQYGPKSGIYDYGARFYSADIGRFLQADSIVPGPGNPQALNRYSYVLNNPLTHTDPTGHCVPDVNCPGDYCLHNTECGEPSYPAPANPPRSGGGSGGAGGSSSGSGSACIPWHPPCEAPSNTAGTPSHPQRSPRLIATPAPKY